VKLLWTHLLARFAWMMRCIHPKRQTGSEGMIIDMRWNRTMLINTSTAAQYGGRSKGDTLQKVIEN